MTDEEYISNIRKMISYTRLQCHTFRLEEIDEALGNWDELLTNREGIKDSFTLLFSVLEEDLSEDINHAIIELKENEYPFLLCMLGKCYIVKERYDDAKYVLNEAANHQFAGAKTLLGMAFFGGRESASDIHTAFSLLTSEDIMSATIRDHICNDRFLVTALYYLAAIYRIQYNDISASYECILRILNADIDEEMKDGAKEELRHYKKGFLGRLTYVE